MACKHTKQPEGYVEWHDWAEKKADKHYQVKCPKCGLYAIWKRKKGGLNATFKLTSMQKPSGGV